MKVLETITKIYEKMRDNRWRNDIFVEEVICKLKMELSELGSETGTSDMEALFLASIAMATISKETIFSNYQIDLHKIGNQIDISIYEVLRHYRVLETLAEKGLIIISDYDFEIRRGKMGEAKSQTEQKRIKFVIPQFNKKFELSDEFVNKMLGH